MFMQPVYETIAADVESLLYTALSDIDDTYDRVGIYKIAPYEVTKFIELEQQIYATPCKKVDYGPVYYQPPDNEKKIYEEFEGKRFRKLFHKEIK